MTEQIGYWATKGDADHRGPYKTISDAFSKAPTDGELWEPGTKFRVGERIPWTVTPDFLAACLAGEVWGSGMDRIDKLKFAALFARKDIREDAHFDSAWQHLQRLVENVTKEEDWTPLTWRGTFHDHVVPELTCLKVCDRYRIPLLHQTQAKALIPNWLQPDCFAVVDTEEDKVTCSVSGKEYSPSDFAQQLRELPGHQLVALRDHDRTLERVVRMAWTDNRVVWVQEPEEEYEALVAYIQRHCPQSLVVYHGIATKNGHPFVRFSLATDEGKSEGDLVANGSPGIVISPHSPSVYYEHKWSWNTFPTVTQTMNGKEGWLGFRSHNFTILECSDVANELRLLQTRWKVRTKYDSQVPGRFSLQCAATEVSQEISSLLLEKSVLDE